MLSDYTRRPLSLIRWMQLTGAIALQLAQNWKNMDLRLRMLVSRWMHRLNVFCISHDQQQRLLKSILNMPKLIIGL